MPELNKQSLPISIPEYLTNLTSDIATQADCGVCQSSAESCGSSEHGSCSACEGLGCMGSEGCSSACEKSSQKCTSGCEVSDEGGCIGGQCSSSQSCYGCERSQGCGGCEDGCQDSECAGCQTSAQIATQPTWSCTATGKSITGKITNPGNYSYFSWSLRTTSGTILQGPTDYDKSTLQTFRGLTPNTKYRIYMSWSTSTTGEGNYEYKSITTTSATVDPWDWTASNGEATADQTVIAYDVVNNPDSSRNVAYFSYLVWNDLVDKVFEAWEADDGSWNSKYLSYNATRMTSSDRTLTAARFNSLRYNIGVNVSTDIDEVAKGDTVYGWYFERMTNCLNKWISNIS